MKSQIRYADLIYSVLQLMRRQMTNIYIYIYFFFCMFRF